MAIVGVFSIPLGFVASMLMHSYQHELDTVNAPKKPLWVQFRTEVRRMFRHGWHTGKNFAVIGAMWTGCECALEQYRGTSDIWNNMAAAVATGALISFRGGLPAIRNSVVGFAAFSLVIEIVTGRLGHRPFSFATVGL